MRIGFIIGTGVDFLAPGEEWTEVASPYGASITTATVAGQPVAVLRRHGPAQNVPPHLINYKANMLALKEMGIERVIATAAVGSMRKDLPIGSLAVVGDFVDYTKRRDTTIYDRPMPSVSHTDFSTPYCPEISAAMEQAAEELRIALGKRVTYLCVDGPRYETPAEIRMFAQLGGDVVGMTGVPEVIIARELGICYGSLAVVSNYAAGVGDGPISHQEVVERASACQSTIRSLFEGAIALIPEARACAETTCGSSVSIL